MPKPSRLTRRRTFAGRTPEYSIATLPPMLWPSRSIGAAVDAEERIEDELEVAEVLGEVVGVGGRRVARSEAAPVEGERRGAPPRAHRRRTGTRRRRPSSRAASPASAGRPARAAARPIRGDAGAGRATSTKRLRGARFGVRRGGSTWSANDCTATPWARLSTARRRPAGARIRRHADRRHRSRRSRCVPPSRATSSADRRPDPRPGRIREARATSCQATPETLAPHLFGPRPVVESVVAESDGRGRRVRALLHQLLDLPRLARPLPRGPLRRARAARPRHRPGLARAPRAPRGDARLRPLRVERARLERRRDPLLRAHGRDGDARLAHLPHRGRRRSRRTRNRDATDDVGAASASSGDQRRGDHDHRRGDPVRPRPRAAGRSGAYIHGVDAVQRHRLDRQRGGDDEARSQRDSREPRRRARCATRSARTRRRSAQRARAGRAATAFALRTSRGRAARRRPGCAAGVVR